MWRWACLFIEDISQSPLGWWQPVCRSAWLRLHVRRHLVLHMAVSMIRMSCKVTPRPPHVWFVGWLHADRHHTAHMSINMLRLQIRRHLVLLHVSPHVLLPCVPTTPACVDRQLIRWLTPRSEPMQRATSSFSIHWSDFGPSGKFLICD